MRNLCQCMDNQSIGLFESPTGTGKTLSVICSLVTWLHNHRQRCLASQELSYQWQAAQVASAQADTHASAQEARPAVTCSSSASHAPAQAALTTGGMTQGPDHTTPSGARVADDQQQCEPDWLRDFQPTTPPKRVPPAAAARSPGSGELSPPCSQPASQPEPADPAPPAAGPEPAVTRVQVIFAARTHSQLSQFTGTATCLRRHRLPLPRACSA